MAVVSCFLLSFEHASPRVAADGLVEYHSNQVGTEVEQVQLPAGQAVVTRTASTSTLTANDQTIEVTNHAITAWIPNPSESGASQSLGDEQ